MTIHNIPPVPLPTLRRTSLDAKARTLLHTHGSQIASAISRDAPHAGSLKATILQRNNRCLVIRVGVDGKSGVVKAYAQGDERARSGFAHETALLSALNNTGLAPGLRSRHPSDQFLVMSWVDGASLADDLDLENLPARARQLGAWFRQFHEVMPKEPAKVTWWEFLVKEGDRLLNEHLAPYRSELERMPIRRRTIAKNDAQFSNFIITPHGELIGLDFEATRVRPEGWDLLLAARSLARRFPDQIDRFIGPLVGGWRTGDDETGLPFDPLLVRLFAEAAALQVFEAQSM